MQHLNKGYNIDGKYIVAMFLKDGIYNENYRVLDTDGNSFFMKLYDKAVIGCRIWCQGNCCI